MIKSLLIVILLGVPALAQPRQEVGLTLGRLAGAERTPASAGPGLRLDAGTALQANYGVRLTGGPRFAVFAEVHLLANPQRVVTSPAASATRDVASLYVTPGLRLKFWPRRRWQPYAAVGGGYALHEHSELNVGGAANAAQRTAATGALVYGGGLDVTVWRWLGFRGEVRDFVTGNPRYNVAVRGRQHNVVVGGGLALRF